MTDDQTEIIAFLSRPESYGPGPGTVARCETHASLVFLVGDFAYKLKRAIKYPYLDYSTVRRRRQMCERELTVNRRNAPDIYCEVRPIVRTADGRLAFGTHRDSEEAVDWVLVMRRFDQKCLFGSMARNGALTVAMARQLGAVIAQFHANAERTPTLGGAAQIERVLAENSSILGRYSWLRAEAEKLDEQSRAALGRLRDRLEERRLAGFVRRCHGDLHLDNIVLGRDGPLLLDAIEFNDDFACIDVLYDLAFPLMELMRLGLRAHASALLNRYLERSGDYGGLAALPLFVACRAAIRAHVTLAREAIDNVGGGTAESEARAFLMLARENFDRGDAKLVGIGGVSGTGKSTLAYALASSLRPAPGAIVIRSDITRKRLCGVGETSPLPAEAYSDAMHARVFATMAYCAAATLAAGFSAIVDGVFGAPTDRSRLHKLAKTAKVPFLGLWLEAPTESLRRRVASRHDDASDATLGVLERQLTTVRRPQGWSRLDAADLPDRVLRQAQAVLDGQT